MLQWHAQPPLWFSTLCRKYHSVFRQLYHAEWSTHRSTCLSHIWDTLSQSLSLSISSRCFWIADERLESGSSTHSTHSLPIKLHSFGERCFLCVKFFYLFLMFSVPIGLFQTSSNSVISCHILRIYPLEEGITKGGDVLIKCLKIIELRKEYWLHQLDL